jgi:ribosomal protein L11 methyltransferase
VPLTLDTQNLHPTTEACLLAMQRLQDTCEFSTILDIGCGNGILSVVAAHAWDARVLAADISPNAVKDATATVAAYRLEDRIRVIRSDGFSDPQISAGAPYDLVVCNLLADLLLRMAPDVKNSLAPGGYAILSGSLSWLAEGVKQAYLDLGFEIVEEITLAPWVAYLARHKAVT